MYVNCNTCEKDTDPEHGTCLQCVREAEKEVAMLKEKISIVQSLLDELQNRHKTLTGRQHFG